MNQWVAALILLAVSLGISVVLYQRGVPFFFAVFLLPLVPLLGRRDGEP